MICLLFENKAMILIEMGERANDLRFYGGRLKGRRWLQESLRSARLEC